MTYEWYGVISLASGAPALGLAPMLTLRNPVQFRLSLIRLGVAIGCHDKPVVKSQLVYLPSSSSTISSQHTRWVHNPVEEQAPAIMSGRYIVIFKDSATEQQIKQYAENVNSNGGNVTNVYDSVLRGFAAAIPDNFLSSLQGDDIIEYIEPDGVVTTQ